MMDRAAIVHENFLRRVAAGEFPAPVSGLSPAQVGLSPAQLVRLFRSQVLSRQLDRRSRQMQKEKTGFYTIGSSGHEGNAAIAAALRTNDMAFLHYRDAAFLIQRMAEVPGQTPVFDLLTSFAAAAADPVSGGRHKVLGSHDLFVPPQTSTIASHLPKAMGTAYSIGLSRRLEVPGRVLATDSIVLCSFGDASLNHSTAQGAINTACWSAFQGAPMPLLLVCEDNGIGISTRSPQGWVRASMAERPGLKYFSASGLDLLETFAVACEAARYVRDRRKPAFLHLQCVRLYGHAGADVQTAYLDRAEVEAAEADDPLLHSARILIVSGVLSAEQVLAIYRDVEQQVEHVARHVASLPPLKGAAQVARSLVPPRKAVAPLPPVARAERADMFAAEQARMDKPQHMARLLNWALSDLMLADRSIVLAGEDIGPKGGVYHVTARLHARFGANRVINTLLDEQSILGLAIGLAHNGFLPIPEIQFLAYLHNAEDQLRGEAATLSFFSNGRFTNPMVVRIAGLGYQKGFGGHFHNDNSLAVLRDIPGLVIACPSNGRDAVLMLREAHRLAREEQRVVVFLEPIALYMTRDLHKEGDGRWTCDYPLPDAENDPAAARGIAVYGKGTDLAIISYANGFYLSLKAERILREQHGLKLRVIDLRWLAPLDEQAILKAVAPCSGVLIVDECRRTGSQSEALMALLMEQGGEGRAVSRLTATDCFIPLGRAATATLPDRDGIVAAALELAGSGASPTAGEKE